MPGQPRRKRPQQKRQQQQEQSVAETVGQAGNAMMGVGCGILSCIVLLPIAAACFWLAFAILFN